jgi:hypothetical protein
MPANCPARFDIRLAAQLAPKPFARSERSRTMPGRSGPITVATSETAREGSPSVSVTVRRIIGARGAKRSSCRCAGTLPCTRA